MSLIGRYRKSPRWKAASVPTSKTDIVHRGLLESAGLPVLGRGKDPCSLRSTAFGVVGQRIGMILAPLGREDRNLSGGNSALSSIRPSIDNATVPA
jgi:hypothetical protein